MHRAQKEMDHIVKQYIGVEIGGTKQQIASFDENGEMIRIISEKIPLPNGARDIRDWMCLHIPELITPDTAAIGVGFGGIVDSRSGISTCSVHVPGWEQFPLKTWFEKTFSLPTTVVNDTVCGGYAEVLFGTGVGHDIFFYTNIGTGCGGALFMHGKSYDGWGMGGAYLGQCFVPAWDEADKVERMENLCSGSSIERRIRRPGYIPETSLLYRMVDGKTETARCPDLCTAAREGDAFALAEIDRWARRYATALTNFITLFAPTRVAIGGGVSNNGDIVLDPIRRYCEEMAFVSVKGKYDIVRCKTMDNAVLIGAAMYARDGFATL